MKDIRDKVTSVCGDMFKHIVYYPVFDVKDEAKIVAVIEVGYKKRSTNPLLTQDMQSYIDQFRSHLDQFSVRLTSYCRGLQACIKRRQDRRTCQVFQRWKERVVEARFQDQVDDNTRMAEQT